MPSSYRVSVCIPQVLYRLLFRRIGMMLAFLVIAGASQGANAQSLKSQELAGDYFLNARDIASGIRISMDGTYRFFTMIGSVDEIDQGVWRLDGDELHAKSATPDTPPRLEFVSSEKGSFEGTQIRLIGEDVRKVNNTLWIRLDSPAGVSSTTRKVEDDLQVSSMNPPIKQLTLALIGGIRSYGTLIHVPSSPDHNLFTFSVSPGNLGIMRLDETRILLRGDTLIISVPKLKPAEDLVYTRTKPASSAPSTP